VLKLFADSYGPMRREASGGVPMGTEEWSVARLLIALHSSALAAGLIAVALQALHAAR
jgi:hypothetical protein